VGHNGQLHETSSHLQHLGNGYRVYSPSLMRFLQPDRQSPFGQGDLNAYAYCNLDPINRSDPSGHFALWIASGVAAVGILGVFTTGAVTAYHADKHKLASVLAIVGAGLAVAVMTGGVATALARAMPRARSPVMIRVARSHPVTAIPRPVGRFQPLEARGRASVGNPPLNRVPRFQRRAGSLDAQHVPTAAAPPASLPARARVHPQQKMQPQPVLDRALSQPSARPPGSILRAKGKVAAVNKRVRFNDDLDMRWFDRDDDISVWNSDAS